MVPSVSYARYKLNKYLNKESFVSGVANSFSVCLSFALMFFSLGMLTAAQKISLFKCLFMTFSLFAVPLQALILDRKDLTLLSVALSAFIINFKFFPISSKLVSSWKNLTLVKKMNLYFICTRTNMVSVHEKNKACNWSYLWGIASKLSNGSSYCLPWLFSLGSFPEQKKFLEAFAHIVLPVHFICLTMKRKAPVMPVIITFIGICMTPLLVAIFGKKFLIFSWLIVAGILLTRVAFKD